MRADQNSSTAASHAPHERRRKEEKKPGSRTETCMFIFCLLFLVGLCETNRAAVTWVVRRWRCGFDTKVPPLQQAVTGHVMRQHVFQEWNNAAWKKEDLHHHSTAWIKHRPLQTPTSRLHWLSLDLTEQLHTTLVATFVSGLSHQERQLSQFSLYTIHISKMLTKYNLTMQVFPFNGVKSTRCKISSQDIY